MIYRFLKLLLGLAVRVFYRNLEVKGLENIPSSGPLILVANHPNTILDPIAIGTSVDRELFFLAKGILFKSKMLKWLLPKCNVIPIYRAQDDSTEMTKNEDTFAKCFEHLAGGGTLLIFPEGISLNERKLRKIKTGTARIALGAEEANDFKLGLNIVGIGLNYSSHHRFHSDLFINIAKPIQVNLHKEAYRKDPIAATVSLTDAIRKNMEQQIIAIEDDGIDRLVKQIETIYKSQLLRDLGYSPKMKEQDFLVTRAISDIVHFYQLKDPPRVEKMQSDIDAYFFILNELELTDSLVKKFPSGGSAFLRSLANLLYFVVGLPFFLFGAATNYLPFKIPEWIAKKIIPSREYLGSVVLLTGVLTFTLFYLLQLWLVQHFFQNFLFTVAWLAAMPLAGFFAYFYAKRLSLIRGRWKILSLFNRRNELISSILDMRKQLIDELEKGRKEFLEQEVANIEPLSPVTEARKFE